MKGRNIDTVNNNQPDFCNAPISLLVRFQDDVKHLPRATPGEENV